jgi:hypothetical protein
MSQKFKGDALELKYEALFTDTLEALSMQLDAFFEDAYNSMPFGDLIFDDLRSPLSNAIAKDIFRESFGEIVDAFVEGGTFESYITVFKKIFGDTVDIEFTVPDPGQLQISIIADGVEESLFISRYIQSNDYVFDQVIDDEDDNIVFQSIKGFQSQYELEQMLFEMVPGGIYTEITLELGE